MLHHTRPLIGLAVCAVPLAVSQGDVVTDWNTVLLDTIRAVGGTPCNVGRSGAMLHSAIFDAVNSIDRRYTPYLSLLDAPPGASPEAAAAAAGHRVLLSLYPSRQAELDAALAASLAAIPDGPGESAGIAIGIAAADAIIADRADDGSQNEPPYPIGTNPGDWRPTPPDFLAAVGPGCGLEDPWTLLSADQFRPIGPLGFSSTSALLPSRGYANNVNEVKTLGTLVNSTRTPFQTRTAFFWANDADGTFKPPGHLNYTTQVISADRGLCLVENARLFALVNLGMGDAGIAAWDVKYDTDLDLWRPVTAIRLAATDNNPRTTADPNWLPLSVVAPPFPSYVSGHATFAGAWAAVLTGYFGTDEVMFTIGTDDPNYTGGPRTYTRFSDAAREDARSRIFLGVHFQFDATDGLALGNSIGEWAVSRFLLPVCPADFNGDGRLTPADVAEFVQAFFHHDPRADFDRDGDVDFSDLILFVREFIEGCP